MDHSPLALKDQPLFRVEVKERNRLQELLGTLDCSSHTPRSINPNC